MKRALFSITLFSAISLSVLSSCKKDKDDPNQEMAITVQNVIGTYKITAETDKIGTYPEINSLEEDYDDCELDDLIKLLSDNVFTYEDAGVKCEEGNGETSVWALEDNQLIIGERAYDIVKLTRSQIVIKFTRLTWYEGAEHTGVRTTTFTRQ